MNIFNDDTDDELYDDFDAEPDDDDMDYLDEDLYDDEDNFGFLVDDDRLIDRYEDTDED